MPRVLCRVLQLYRVHGVKHLVVSVPAPVRPLDSFRTVLRLRELRKLVAVPADDGLEVLQHSLLVDPFKRAGRSQHAAIGMDAGGGSGVRT